MEPLERAPASKVVFLFNKRMKEEKLTIAFLRNFVGGIGWALGITFGFTIVAYALSKLLESLGGLPLIGSTFADLIKVTQDALIKK